ncbi:CxC2 domain-containing protein [Favolaschia claudopus]|uniref:CxC2 domain-containing protein n=1 Tax=Favolaschia claudopus TaxID=2862362 RepID=A0AAW0AML2_9AGAR
MGRRGKQLRGAQRMADEYVITTTVAEFLGPTPEAPVDTIVEQVSADGRRVRPEVIPVEPPSPVKRARISAQDSAAPTWNADPLPFEPEGLNGERYDMELGGFFLPKPAKRAKKPFKPSDQVLYDFRPLRDEYLLELLRMDGCGDASEEHCPTPGCDATPTIRCTQCFGGLLYCTTCCKDLHSLNPLHIIERWNGVFFERVSLKDLGLRIQLGHAGCHRPQAGHRNFVVLDVGGIHEVAVDFCGCDQESEMGLHRTQILRRGWFPATHNDPRTAMTFRLLDVYLTQTLQAKTTAFDYYTTLEKLMAGAGQALPRRYREFLRVTRLYRHLLMLKRGGRGHASSGVSGTTAGELAIRCPACPRPEVNLPEGWEDAPPETRFIYVMFLALDACFRLKRRLVSSDLRDPGLGTGWAYFVEPGPYREFLLTVTDQEEMSTCSGLAALDYANTKFSRGYSVTGPTGVGDLQKGERYANMDYVFASFMRWINANLRKIVSYDIVCQWFKKLRERLRDLPPLVRLHIIMEFYKFVIPKMHIHAHILLCQLLFSLNFLPGAGQTDGEGIERPWANLGGVATSTREMGPGSRHDVLDDHFGWWNWWKLVGIAALIRKRLDNAKRERIIQEDSFNAFTAEQRERVPDWERMVCDYERDPAGNKNPYEVKTSALKEADVRLRLAEGEAASVERGVPALHDVSPSTFIFAGLDLEDEQRRLRVQVALKKAGTTTQKIDLLSMRRKLSRGIARFRKLQATYTPGALQALSRRAAAPDEVPESTPLMLPSALTRQEREAGCISGVQHIERLARDAQCSEALMKLRNQLHIKSRFCTYKELHARHQGANTRARNLVARNESKIRLHSEKYQAAWEALWLLAEKDVSKVGWKRLRREDVRTMEDPEELSQRQALRKRQAQRRREKLQRMMDEGESLDPSELASDVDVDEGVEEDAEDEMVVNTAENVREVSWIWLGAGKTGTDAELEDALRIEWTKARARSRRWKEEVLLLEEEYRRVLVSFEYEAGRWEARAKEIKVGVVEVGFAQGAIAYALKQAAVYRDLATRATVTMTEIHQGRGRKRLAGAGSARAPGDDESDSDEDEDSDEDGDGDGDGENGGGAASEDEGDE